MGTSKAAGIPAPATNAPAKPKKHSWKRFLSVSAAALIVVYLASREPSHPRRRPRPLPAGEAEKLFLTVPNAASALAASREYATHPHLAGSPEDFDDAKVTLKVFQEELGIHPPKYEPVFPAGSHRSRHSTLGLTSRFAPKHPTAWIDTYYPVLNTPLDRSLQLLDNEGNVSFNADLVEDGDPLDPDAAKYRDAVPAWHGLSFDGTATGKFVYANYGTQEDYAELLSKGVDLNGKIVITRYGGIFRGLKIKGAEELGASGVLIYSDPRDDGHVTVSDDYRAYPHGPARNPTSVQRGSVQYLSLYPGDPATPGYPAYKDVERQEGVNIPKIPSLPISWQTALPFLSAIAGKNVTDSYPVLDGKVSEVELKLVNHVDTKVTPIWNTLAAIPGHIHDEVVVLGCHRDAWVLGAADPTSGTVSLREIVRGFGTLLKSGWKPLRTIVIASWDGEEYGLVGSTEWGEDFHPWIAKHVVAYLNLDVSVAGSKLEIAASPSLADIIKRTASDIPHPTKPGSTLWDARTDQGPFLPESGFFNATTATLKPLASLAPDSEVTPLGSGSDFTVFLQRIGIASSDQSFGPTEGDAVYHYHSVYDSQKWQEVYGDPTFEKHVAIAKHLGLLALRLTDSFIIPLNTTRYSLELDRYLDLVEGLAAKNLPESSKNPDFLNLRESIKALQKASANLDDEKVEAEKIFRDLIERFPPPRLRHHCGHRDSSLLRRAESLYLNIRTSLRSWLSIAPTQRTVGRRIPRTPEELLAFGIAYDEDPEFHIDLTDLFPFPKFPIREFIKAAKRLGRANKKLRAFEGGFISKGGIKDREWYKHLGVAPGKWLGYGATTFPALTEAITIEKNSSLATFEAGRLSYLIQTLTDEITP